MVSKNPFKVEKRELQSMPKCAHVRHIPGVYQKGGIKKRAPPKEREPQSLKGATHSLPK